MINPIVMKLYSNTVKIVNHHRHICQTKAYICINICQNGNFLLPGLHLKCH